MGGTSYSVDGDAFLVKFNKNGAIQWGTYYGGSSWDDGISVTTDTAGSIYITGLTGSAGLATSGAYMTSLPAGTAGNGNVAFIAEFSPQGSLSWATYYGGGSETSSGICIDVANNLYITGTTYSQKGIATSGAYQTSIHNTNNLGLLASFLAKFSNKGALLWGTYYGGNGVDWAYTVAADNFGNVYTTGSTTSTSGFATSGVYQAAYGGTPSWSNHGDAFLVKFDSSGKFKWATYYGGGDVDLGLGVATDSSGFIYVAGVTTSSGNIATKGSFQSTYGGNNSDGFLAKFNNSGGLEWGTYYGGTSIDSVTAVAVDRSNYIYITGNTTGSPGLATSGTYQTSLKPN